MPRPKYPWGDWFASGRFVIRYRDYNCSQEGMIQQVRNAALRAGVKVRCRSEKDGSITVQVRR